METNSTTGTGKKSIKEYLLEGLMIFVALSMGFIADSIRENISERKLENEFLNSLRVDLKADQSFFEEQIQLIDEKNLIADSLIHILNTPPPIKSTANFCYWSRQLQRQRQSIIVTATFDEMKYGSFFRLIKQNGLNKQIVDYYNQIQILRYYEDQFENTADKFRNLYNQVVDPRAFFGTIDKNTGRIIKLGYNPTLKNNTEVLNQMVLQMSSIVATRAAIKSQIINMQERGIKILEVIEKE